MQDKVQDDKKQHGRSPVHEVVGVILYRSGIRKTEIPEDPDIRDRTLVTGNSSIYFIYIIMYRCYALYSNT